MRYARASEARVGQWYLRRSPLSAGDYPWKLVAIHSFHVEGTQFELRECRTDNSTRVPRYSFLRAWCRLSSAEVAEYLMMFPPGESDDDRRGVHGGGVHYLRRQEWIVGRRLR